MKTVEQCSQMIPGNIMKAQNELQTVFRHKPMSRKPSTAKKTKRDFHARQAHTKSRQGCIQCKKRRIKCDETKPACRNCEQVCVTCIFPMSCTSKDLAEEALALTQPKPDSQNFTLAIRSLDESLQALVGHEIHDQRLRASSLETFHHFNNVTVQQLGLKSNYGVLLSCVNENIWQDPAMLQMTLALSNAHLQRLQQGQPPAGWDLAAAAHFQVALRAYRQELDAAVATRNDSHVDNLVANTYLLTVAAFCINDEAPHQDHSDIVQLMQPITAAGSLQSLMQVLPGLRSISSWSQMLDRFATANRRPPFEDLPEAFVQLCQIRPDDDSLYHKMLCYITPVLRAAPCTKQIVQLFAMIGDLWSSIAPKLSAHDHRTLVLFAWWCALLNRIDVWWLQNRARTGCVASVLYLQEHGEEVIQRFLNFPASFGTIDYRWIWKVQRDEAHRNSASAFVELVA